MSVVGAIGVGAAVAAYSLMYAVLFAPLPYRHPESLVRVWEVRAGGLEERAIADYRVERIEPGGPLASIAGYQPVRQYWTDAESEVELRGAIVSVNLFQTLGVEAATGRTFTPADASLTSSPPIILSPQLIRRGITKGIAGDTLVLDGLTYRIVGTMPDSFWFPDRDTLYWTPILSVPRVAGTSIRVRMVNAIARLERDVPIETARAALTAQAEPANSQGALRIASYAAVLREGLTSTVIVLQASAAILLLLVYVNVTWLYDARLARVAGAIRTMRVLGASTRRLVGLHASAVLALAGVTAPLAVLVAWVLMRAGVRLGGNLLTQAADPRLTTHVVIVALATTLVACVAACAPGAFRSLSGALGGRCGPTARQARRRGLAALCGQVAVIFTVATLAVYLATLLLRVSAAGAGLPKNDGLVVTTQLAAGRSVDPAVHYAGYKALMRSLGEQGLQAAATGQFPLAGGDYLSTFEPRISREQERVQVRVRVVSPDYFTMTGMPALRGHLLGDGDIGARAAVVTPAFQARVLGAGRRSGRGSASGENGRLSA